MLTSHQAGFNHGNSGNGTNGYKPGNRKPGSAAFFSYNEGFQAGMRSHHDATSLLRRQLAWLNQPKATRGPRPE